VPRETTDGVASRAIVLKEMRFRYPGGGFALEVPELAVAAGEAVAVVGSSGSGKTTLLHLVAGILNPESGDVLLDGVRIGTLSDAERRNLRSATIGLVFQDFELVPHLDVLENILLPYFLHARLALDAAARARAERIAQDLGIADKLRRRIGALSHGERQRVAIARALVPEPRILLADEPTGSLDATNATAVRDLILRQVRARRMTLLFVTHARELIGAFDRVVDIRQFEPRSER